ARVVVDESNARANRRWVRRDRALECRLDFGRTLPGDRDELGERKKHIFVLGILGENLFVSLASVFGFTLLKIKQCERVRGTEIVGIELERLIEAGARILHIAQADINRTL